MTELFSEMGKDSTYVRPEHMLVLKASNRSYPAFWNAEKQKFGGLLEASIFTSPESIPSVENTEVINYREITGIKN